MALFLGPLNIGLPELCIILGVALLALPGLAFWIWSIVDCATKEPDTGNTKVVWIIIIVVAGFIGSLLYVLIRRPKRKAECGQ